MRNASELCSVKKAKKGFTLVELLVVIAIIAVLATVTVVGYTVFLSKAKDSKAMQELEQVQTLLSAEGFEGNGAFSFDGKKMTYDITSVTGTGEEREKAANEAFLTFIYSKCADFGGIFTAETSIEKTDASVLNITSITYEKDGGSVTWDIATGEYTYN